MHPKTILRTAKSWHGSDQTVILQISVNPPHLSLPKKLYLICDSNQKTRGFRFSLDKPDDLKNQGLAANILRKQMPAAILLDIMLERASGDFWALFTAGREATPLWYIRINRAMPPDLSFISSARDVFFRIGSAGSFSKRQTYSEALPTGNSEGWASLLDGLLNELGVRQMPIPEAAELSTNEATHNFPLYQREARDRLARRAKTVKKSLEKLRQQTPDSQAISVQKRNAHLLQQFAYLLTEDQAELTLTPDQTGLQESLTIQLDTVISTGQHINDAFSKTKKMQKSLDVGGKKLISDERNLRMMMEDLELLRGDILDQSGVEAILKKHSLSAEKQPAAHKSSENQISKPYKEYCSAAHAKIFVGKSAADSDELVKSARSNDYWFHIIGTTGSHVIVSFKSLRGGQLADEVKRDAAILAIHNSKFRTDLAGEVYVTRKQHLRKKKGMPPGLWNVDKSESFYIKYTEDDLKKVLEQFSL